MLITLSLGIVTRRVKPSGFGYGNSGVGIRVGVQLPKALSQVACIAGSGWSGDQ